jgi:ankyrin repeat protein
MLDEELARLHNMLDGTLSPVKKLPPFTAAYLEHRVAREPSDGIPALVCIRKVAERLTYDVETRNRYIAYLCALAVPNIKCIFVQNPPVHRVITLEPFEDHVQAAAVYMHHVSDIERWEAPMTSSSLFGSCFRLAATSGSPEMIELYLRQQCLPYRNRAFVEAAKEGQADMVRFLFDYHSDTHPWTYTEGSINASMYPSGYRALMQALSTPNPEIWDFVMQLLRENDVTIKEGQESNMLERAAEDGRTDMVRHLLHHGTPTRAPGKIFKQESPIWYAAQRGHLEIVQALLDRGATVPLDTMRDAALSGHIQVVRLLLAYKANTTGAVVDAAKGGYGDVVELLLENEGNPNEDDGELPAIAYAILAEHMRMYKCLLDHGARLPGGPMREESLERAKLQGVGSMPSLLSLASAHGSCGAGESLTCKLDYLLYCQHNGYPGP